MKVWLAAFAFTLAACGSDQGAGGNTATDDEPNGAVDDTDPDAAMRTARILLKGEPLPDCDDTSAGALIYQEDEGFKFCKGEKWVAIDLKGEDGKDGEDGTDNKITASIFCNGTLEGESIGFSYSVAEMASGDIFVSATITGGFIAASNSAFYSPAQNGAQNPAITIQSDFSGTNDGGWWRLVLDRETLVTTITYNDVGEAADGDSWTMDADSCVTNVFTEDEE